MSASNSTALMWDSSTGNRGDGSNSAVADAVSSCGLGRWTSCLSRCGSLVAGRNTAAGRDLGWHRLGEAAGELFAVVGQHFRRHSIGGHGLGEGGAYRAAGRLGDHLGDHDEPGVVVDAGDQLALAPAGQEHPAHDVQLPQLHRGIALPAAIDAAVILLLVVDQSVTGQDPVRGGPAGHWHQPGLAQLVDDSAGTPAGYERRSSQTRASTSTGTWCGETCGRCDLSTSASSPPAWHPSVQLYTDCRDAPNWRATCATGAPSNTWSTAR